MTKRHSPDADASVEYQDPAEIALEPFERPESAEHSAPDGAEDVLANALKKVLSDEITDHDLIDIEDLATLDANEDTVARARQAYTLSYLKLLDFLRRTATTFSERAWQARLAFQIVKHTEQNSLDRLKMGRSKLDGELEERLTEVRAEVERLARLEQAVAIRKQQAKDAQKVVNETPQESGGAAEGGSQDTPKA